MTSEDLHATLARLHAELERAPHLDGRSRQLLQRVMQEARAAMERPSTPPVDRAGLEALAVQFETEHPDLSAGVRQFIDLLGKGGL